MFHDKVKGNLLDACWEQTVYTHLIDTVMDTSLLFNQFTEGISGHNLLLFRLVADFVH